MSNGYGIPSDPSTMMPIQSPQAPAPTNQTAPGPLQLPNPMGPLSAQNFTPLPLSSTTSFQTTQPSETATNQCGLFGDMLPKAYIDRVFLEESLIDIDNDGTAEYQTPRITVNLKLLDTLNDSGEFSILEEALQLTNQNGTVDLKEYIKVNCILFTSKSKADEFIERVETLYYSIVQGMPTEYVELNAKVNAYLTLKFMLMQNFIDSDFIQTTTLSAFTDSYVNQHGVTEIVNSFDYELDKSAIIDYLRVFAFVELDTQKLGADLINGEVPEAFKCIVSPYSDQVVVENVQTISELTTFYTESGEVWDRSFHVHVNNSGNKVYMEGRSHTPTTSHGTLTKSTRAVNNVQDFRIRDMISAFIVNAAFAETVQNEFPEKSDILNQATANKSYISELFITKDENRHARFYFAFDYGAYILDNIRYSKLVSTMGQQTKQKILDNSQIVGFNVSRVQVEEHPARNKFVSPIRNRIVNNAKKIPIVSGSLDDPNITEINIILPNQPGTEFEKTFIRHFTGLDAEMRDIEDGAYQYSVDAEIVDGFVPVLREYLSELSRAIAAYKIYVTTSQIPGVYDPHVRKFTNTPANPSSVIVNGEVDTTMTGVEIMSSFGAGVLDYIINTYLTTLDLFVELDSANPAQASRRQMLGFLIATIISPTIGTIDGILIFEDLMDQLLARINNLLSVGSDSVAVEPTTSNRAANSISSFKDMTIKITEDFENTIDARFLHDSYINNINAQSGGFSGLNIYYPLNLANAQPTVTSPESVVMSDLEELAQMGVSIYELPSAGAAIDDLLPLYSFGYAFDSSKISPGLPGADGITTEEALLGQVRIEQESKSLSKTDLNAITPEDARAFIEDNRIENPSQSKFEPITQVSTITDPGTMVSQIKTKKKEKGFSHGPLDQLGTMLPKEEDNEFTNPLGLQATVDVLTSFSAPVTPFWQSTTALNTYMLRRAVFETKEIGQLASAGPNSFYLCRQTRRSDLEVVDCFFLLVPPTHGAAPLEQGGLPGSGLTNPGDFDAGLPQIQEKITSDKPVPFIKFTGTGSSVKATFDSEVLNVMPKQFEMAKATSILEQLQAECESIDEHIKTTVYVEDGLNKYPRERTYKDLTNEKVHYKLEGQFRPKTNLPERTEWHYTIYKIVQLWDSTRKGIF